MPWPGKQKLINCSSYAVVKAYYGMEIQLFPGLRKHTHIYSNGREITMFITQLRSFLQKVDGLAIAVCFPSLSITKHYEINQSEVLSSKNKDIFREKKYMYLEKRLLGYWRNHHFIIIGK